jgi:hypothetical protein
MPGSSGRRYDGLYRDNPNHPARRLLALRADPKITLPPKATTSQFMGPIYDQGSEGKCTGELKAEYRNWLYRALFKWEKDKALSPDQFVASPDFGYLTNLIADGLLGNDNGSSIHQTFVTLNQLGCCPLSDAASLVGEYTTAPTAEQYAAAMKYKGGPYHFLPTLQDMKSCIAPWNGNIGYPFGFGIAVYESFEADAIAETGFMPMPGRNERLLGLHAQFGMDYDDNLEFPKGFVPSGRPGGVLVQNSWGEWGISVAGRIDRGCYWMPYEFFAKVDPGVGPCVSDGWMMHLSKAW